MNVREGFHAYLELGTVLAVEPNYIAAGNGSVAANADGSLDVPGPSTSKPDAITESVGLHSLPPGSPTAFTPNDPHYTTQWNLKKISATEAWAVTTGSTNVIVAVVDTGIDYNHSDLAANMWHNPGETGLDAQGRDKATNGIDDDGDGYVDDVYGINVTKHDGDPMDGG